MLGRPSIPHAGGRYVTPLRRHSRARPGRRGRTGQHVCADSWIGHSLLPTIIAVLATLPPTVTRAQDESLAIREQAAIRAAVQNVAESVVQIRTIGGLDVVGNPLPAGAPTSGLVISPDGYIVSSASGFVERPASILAVFSSGQQVPAELVATDHSRMLVLLKVDAPDDLQVPEFAPVDDIHVGGWAIAVGRAFRADVPNISVGIVSATGRMFGKVLQTDAAVSAANYGGPLVDIRGRVIGLLVPMAPQSTSAVAGVEWYDSGIGFAVPLSAISEPLQRMRQGEDLYAGLMGISLKANQPRDARAELAAVRPNSPAGQAGFKKGDRIVELDGRPIRTQTALRFALGPRYGGETVHVVALRGNQRIEHTIQLVGQLEVFRHAYLGILPMRPDTRQIDAGDASQNVPPGDASTEESLNGDAAEPPIAEAAAGQSAGGVVVRMVCAGSPADKAGIEPGDCVVQINNADIVTTSDAIAEMNTVVPGAEVALRVLRDERALEFTLTAARLPTTVPSQLPPARTTVNEPAQPPPDARELKLPEFDQTCRLYVPASHADDHALGVLLWLHAPGQSRPDEVIRHWRPICDRDGLILLVPTAADANRWERTELVYLRGLVERVASSFRIDRHRVVVYGEGGGGAMAYLLALASRDLMTGVAVSSAALPRQVRVPENDPALRLAVLSALPPDGDSAAYALQGVKELAEAGYPVTTLSLPDETSRLATAEREALARWIDTLDRF